MKYCTKCGSIVNENDIYCSNCGNVVNTSSLTQEQINNRRKVFEDNQVHHERKEVTKDSSSGSLVLGILSIVFLFSGMVPVGIILSIIGLCIDKNGKHKKLNIAGLVLNLCFPIIILIITFLILGFSSPGGL